MNKVHTPFRYDYVGSFLRPEELKKARADFEAGTIDTWQLKEVEDRCITQLVAKQKAAGYHVITDGEFRRATWHLDFMWGFEGIGHSATQQGLPFHGEAAKIDDTYLTGKLSVGVHPFVEHFKFVKALEDENTVAKQTIPAPAQFLEQLIMPMNLPDTRKFYPTDEELIADLVAGYKKVIADLYAAGCRNLQFDDCTWGCFVDPKATLFFGTDEAGLEKLQEEFLLVNNLALEGKPEDLVVNTHIWSPRLEDKAAVIARIHEAAKYVPLDRLCLSPQCGFASCEIGNKLTEAEQWAKLALVKEIAEEVWG